MQSTFGYIVILQTILAYLIVCLLASLKYYVPVSTTVLQHEHFIRASRCLHHIIGVSKQLLQRVAIN